MRSYEFRDGNDKVYWGCQAYDVLHFWVQARRAEKIVCPELDPTQYKDGKHVTNPSGSGLHIYVTSTREKISVSKKRLSNGKISLRLDDEEWPEAPWVEFFI